MIEYRDLLEKRQFLINFCMSLKNKYFYAPVPKAAHSTVKLMLSQLELKDLNIPTTDLKVHQILSSPFVHSYQVSGELFTEIVQSPEFYRFSIVRDPFDRAISCYLDKIVRGSPERRVIARILGKAEGDAISLTEFLKAIKTQNVLNMDMHWKPQTAVLLWGRIAYDFVGRMENLRPDLDVIFERITGQKTDQVVTVQDVRHHATSATELSEEYLKDGEAKSLIKEIYGNDFTAFSYSLR